MLFLPVRLILKAKRVALFVTSFCNQLLLESHIQLISVFGNAEFKLIAMCNSRRSQDWLRKMKKGKAQGPDDIPVKAWIAVGNKGVEFLVNFFNRLLRGEKMPDEWRKSVLVPLYKGKGDIKECGNYRGIKLVSHTMKLW